MKTAFKAYLICLYLIVSCYSQILELNMKKNHPVRQSFRPLAFAVDSETNNDSNIFSTKNAKVAITSNLLHLVRMKEGLYTISVFLGDPLQEFEVIVDTGSFLLWIPSAECKQCNNFPHKFNSRNSKSTLKTDKTITLKYLTGSVSGNLAKDQLSFGSDKMHIPQFSFLLSNVVEAPVTVDGIIGLSRSYKNHYDDDVSLLENLFKANSINKRIFSQKLSEGEPKFFIGDMPDEIKQDMDNYTKCNAITDNYLVKSFWSCKISKISFLVNKSHQHIVKLNSEYSNDAKNFIEVLKAGGVPAIFDTGSNVIIAPQNMFTSFRDIMFKKHLSDGTCHIMQDYSNSSGFRCNQSIDFEDFPMLHMAFDNNNSYGMLTKELFIEEDGGQLFRIVFSKVPADGWLLGQPFLKNYHMVFNKEDNTIGFYDNDQKMVQKNHNNVFFEESDIYVEASEVDDTIIIASVCVGVVAVVGLIIGLITRCKAVKKTQAPERSDLYTKFTENKVENVGISQTSIY